MAGRMTGAGEDRGDHVDVVGAFKTQRPDLRQQLHRLTETAQRAHLVHVAAAPGLIVLDGRTCLIAKDVGLCPAVGDGIGVGGIGVADHRVSHGARLRSQPFERLLSAEALLDREGLGPAAVMPALVPADQTDLRLVDAMRRKDVQKLGYVVKRSRHMHFRLGFGRLLAHRRRDGLPSLTDAHIDALRRIARLRTLLGANVIAAQLSPLFAPFSIGQGGFVVVRLVVQQPEFNGDGLIGHVAI